MAVSLLTGSLTFKSLPPLNLHICTKEEIIDYFNNTYDVYESLFTALKDESVLLECPEKLRLQLIFYYAHTAAVYVNKLVLAGLVKPEERVNLEYETLFETGVNEMKWDEQGNFRIKDKPREWPSVDKLVDYRRKVRELVMHVINTTPLHLPIDVDSPWWAVFMGMEHDRIHLETSAVLIRQLPVNLVTRPEDWVYAPPKHGSGAGKNELIRVEGQDIILGNERKYHYYGWDNEFGRRKVSLPAFEANKYLTTHAEFYEFIIDGGYDKSQYWTTEGWSWVQRNKARHPVFWVCGQDCDVNLANCENCLKHTQMSKSNGFNQQKFRFRLMFDVVDMPWDWPVEVNYHEAKAYAAWRGPDYRLITEAELHAISSDEETLCDKPKYEGTDFMKQIANTNLNYGSSSPVNLYPANHLGFHDANGNILHWTEDHFTGYPGFQTTHLYGDFSTPEFDGNHRLILGSSWVTSGIANTRSYRTSFRLHFFQFCGIRLVRSVIENDNKMITVQIPATVLKMDSEYLPKSGNLNVKYAFHHEETASLQRRYDTDDVLNEMLYLEYGSDQNYSSLLCQKISEVIDRYNVAGPSSSALHLGCGTGKLTFHMAPLFGQVVGQDVVNKFVEACMQLQQGQNLTYTHFNGMKKSRISINMKLKKHHKKVIFKELSWLPNEIGTADFILVTNWDRVQNAKDWSARFREVLNKDGVVMVASQQHSIPDLQKIMGDEFEPVEEEQIAVNGNLVEKPIIVSVWKRQ